MNGWMNKYMDGWMNEMDGWMGGWMDGWMKWMDGWMKWMNTEALLYCWHTVECCIIYHFYQRLLLYLWFISLLLSPAYSLLCTKLIKLVYICIYINMIYCLRKKVRDQRHPRTDCSRWNRWVYSWCEWSCYSE